MNTCARTLLLTLAALASPLAQASVTKCYAIGGGVLSVQWLSFEQEKGTATMQFGDRHHSGRVTYVRPHDANGSKYNLVFPSPYTIHRGAEEMEIILFPISDEYWGIGGVITVVVEGRRHVENLVRSQNFNCQTFDQ